MKPAPASNTRVNANSATMSSTMNAPMAADTPSSAAAPAPQQGEADDQRQQLVVARAHQPADEPRPPPGNDRQRQELLAARLRDRIRTLEES